MSPGNSSSTLAICQHTSCEVIETVNLVFIQFHCVAPVLTDGNVSLHGDIQVNAEQLCKRQSLHRVFDQGQYYRQQLGLAFEVDRVVNGSDRVTIKAAFSELTLQID